MTKTYKGTCAWCFRHFVVEGERPVKHGWRESGRTRHVGEYGNVYHTGNCRGMGYPVYEISPRGTVARQRDAKNALADCEKRLTHLATRPTLYCEDRHDIGTPFRTVHAEYGFQISDGERFVIEMGTRPCGYRTYKYEEIWRNRTARTESERRFLKNDIEFCQKAIDEWTIKPLKEHDPHARTMHFAPTERQKKYREQTYCGQKGYGAATTDDEAEVTCTRCRKLLDDETAKKKKQEAAATDGETITAFIREHGPVTPKAIKVALGWDQPRLTKAIEKGAENLSRGPKKPVKWRYLPDITDPTQKAVLETLRLRRTWWPHRGEGLAGLTVKETKCALFLLRQQGWVGRHEGLTWNPEFPAETRWVYKDEM